MTYRRIIDLAERVVLTFVGAFVAVYIAAFAKGQADLAFLRDPDLFDKAQVAGMAAIVPLISGLLGFRVGDKGTASVIPSNKPEEGAAPPDPTPELTVATPTPVATVSPSAYEVPGELIDPVQSDPQWRYYYNDAGM